MNVWTDVHWTQEIAHSDFGDPLTCPLMPPSGQNCHYSITLVYGHMTATLLAFLLASAVLWFVLIGKCYCANTKTNCHCLKIQDLCKEQKHMPQKNVMEPYRSQCFFPQPWQRHDPPSVALILTPHAKP